MSCQSPNEIQLLCEILIISLLTKLLSYFQNFPFKYDGKYGKHRSFASIWFSCFCEFEKSTQTFVDFLGFCSLPSRRKMSTLTLLILKMF